MYSVLAIKERIIKEGLEQTLLFLTSSNLSDDTMQALTDSAILVNGYPNLSLICSL